MQTKLLTNKLKEFIMRKELYTSLSKTLIALFTILLLTNVTLAQEKIYEKLEKKEMVVNNLATAINSENKGLQRSAIYLSGKYEIKEVVPELIKQFKENEDYEVRYLVAIVLYKISDPEGLSLLQDCAKYETNSMVKDLCSAIMEVQEYDARLANR
jgi:HEAT repeats